MTTALFFSLSLSDVISRGTSALLPTIPAPVTFVNIFILGFEVLVRGTNVISRMEVLVATDLDANVIQGVNKLLFDTFWNQWERFSH